MKKILLLSILFVLTSCLTKVEKKDQEIEDFLSKLNILLLKKEIILGNILNINTTRTEKGDLISPYKQRTVNRVVVKLFRFLIMD